MGGTRPCRRLPSLTNYLVDVTSLYSRSRQLTDLYIKPELLKVGMLQWTSHAQAGRVGCEHALLQSEAAAQA